MKLRAPLIALATVVALAAAPQTWASEPSGSDTNGRAIFVVCPDGFGGAEAGKIRIGDTVAIFAQGPIGLCATAGARLMGAA